MTVHFIGAGPGAPDLITVRGLNLIREAGVILYAGSLVPEAVLAEAKPEARVVDTAPWMRLLPKSKPLILSAIISLACIQVILRFMAPSANRCDVWMGLVSTTT